ncbi:MAG: HAD hydrolase-like protein [Helicobacter sp.]|nr:HAD hydrolase-like protein [Helicobacter sp.]
MKQSIDILKTDVLVFDLDGVLMQTDMANNLAYCYAIKNVMKSSLFSSPQRITLKDLEKTSQFSVIKLKAIKNLKDFSYPKYLEYTFVNKNLFEIIIQCSSKKQIILLTNASENRVKLLLKYHCIDKYFSHIFCNTQGNKFLDCIESLQLNIEDLLVFENEVSQIQLALCAGISKDRIIPIKSFNDEFQLKFNKENFNG